MRRLQPAEDQRRFGRMVFDHRNKATEGDDCIGFLSGAFKTEANSIIDEQRRSGARPSTGAIEEVLCRLDCARILEGRLRGQRLTNDFDGAIEAGRFDNFLDADARALFADHVQAEFDQDLGGQGSRGWNGRARRDPAGNRYLHRHPGPRLDCRSLLRRLHRRSRARPSQRL